jgi:hypothetical protein
MFMPFRISVWTIAFVCCLLFVLNQTASAQSELPGVGSWKMNVSKSKLGPIPPPRSLISTIEMVGEHAKVTGIHISTEGVRSEARYSAKLDGKDYPLTGSTHADTISLRKIDSRTIERIDKKAGKVVESSITVFSNDGKTSTTTGKATTSNGDSFEYKFINEKQH